MSIRFQITGAFIAVFSSIFFLPYAQAVESRLKEDQTVVYELEEIVVSPQTETALPQTSVLEISADDIESRDAKTIDQALDFLPGVRLTTGTKNEPNAAVRGFIQERLLVLLDGVPIASPKYGYVDLSQIPVECISRIKLIKGAASCLYGANTMGGVIDIITKRAKDKPHTDAKCEFSENSGIDYVINSGARAGDFDFWLSASHRESDGFNLSSDFKEMPDENGGMRENSDYNKTSLSLKTGFKPGDKYNAAVSILFIDNEKGIPPQTNANNPKYWRFTEWQRKLLVLANEFGMKEDLTFKARVFYDKYDNILDSYDDATYTTQNRNTSWRSIYDDYAVGSNVHFYFQPSQAHFLKGGVNFKRDVHKEQDNTARPWEFYEVRTYSIAVEDEIKPAQKISLTYGTSYDIFQQKETYSGRTAKDVKSISPLLKLEYLFKPQSEAFLSVSRKTCFPTIHQLYDSVSGNPDLKEQRNTNFEAGIKQGFNKTVALDVSWFYNDVKDLIDRSSKNDPFLNTHKAIFRGFEAAINAKINENFAGDLTYTYLDAIDRSPQLLGHSENELQYTPRHKTDLGLRCKIDSGLSWVLLGSYHGRRYYYDSNNIQRDLGGYAVWNTKLVQEIKSWELSLSVENILDRNYQQEEGLPQPGRTIKIGVKKSF